jgi:hypothetical protein
MFIVAIVGVIFFVIAHGGKELSEHLRDDAETPAAQGALTSASLKIIRRSSGNL